MYFHCLPKLYFDFNIYSSINFSLFFPSRVEKEKEALKAELQRMKQQAAESKAYIEAQEAEERKLLKIISEADAERLRQKKELDQVSPGLYWLFQSYIFQMCQVWQKMKWIDLLQEKENVVSL